MKKKIFIGLAIALLVFLVVVFFFIPIHYNNIIIIKGNILFGKGYCPKDREDYSYEDYNHQMVAGQAFTQYRCKLCNKKYSHPTTATPKICSSCAEITGRCKDCGKLQK